MLELDGGDWLLNAGYTGAMAVVVQTIGMGAWMFVSSRQELIASFRHWRQSFGAGFFGAVATAGWFTAFTLHAVAPVRAVGQIELLITIGVSLFYFKETVSRVEMLAILMLALSIIMVLLG